MTLNPMINIENQFQKRDLFFIIALLAILFCFAPFFPHLTFPTFAFAFRSVVILIIAACLYRLGFDYFIGIVARHPLILPFFLINLFCFITLFYTPDPYNGITKFTNIFVLSLLFVALYCLPLQKQHWHAIIWSIVLGALISAAYALYKQWTGHADLIQSLQTNQFYDETMQAELIRSLEANRAIGRFGNPNHLAGYLVITLWGLWYLWLNSKSFLLKVLQVIAGLFLIAAIYQTFSRSGLLVLLISLMMMVLFSFVLKGNKVPWKAILIGFGSLVVIVILLLIFTPLSLLGGRLTHISTVIARLHFFRGAIEIIQNYPIFGVGVEGFQGYYAHYLRPGDIEARYVHNILLEAGVEGGFIGVFLLFWLILAFSKYIIAWWDKCDRIKMMALTGAIASLMILSLIDFHNNLTEMCLIPITLIAMIKPYEITLIRPINVHFLFKFIFVSLLIVFWLFFVYARYNNQMTRDIGYYHMLENEYREAKHYYEKAVWFDRTDAESWRNLGRTWATLQRPGFRANWLECLRKAVSWSPRRASLHSDYAEALFALGYIESALEENKKAQNLFPARPIYYEQRARFLDHLGQDQQAEQQRHIAQQIRDEIEERKL